MANNEVTMERIREELKTCHEHYFRSAPLDQAILEQNCSIIRDAMAQMGMDPANKETLNAVLLGTFLALGHIVNSVAVIGPALGLTFLQATICRMWIDDELPVMSLQDILELQALSAMSPQPCPFVHAWEGGRGSSACSKMDNHQPPHTCPVITADDEGVYTTRQVEVYE